MVITTRYSFGWADLQHLTLSVGTAEPEATVRNNSPGPTSPSPTHSTIQIEALKGSAAEAEASAALEHREALHDLVRVSSPPRDCVGIFGGVAAHSGRFAGAKAADGTRIQSPNSEF